MYNSNKMLRLLFIPVIIYRTQSIIVNVTFIIVFMRKDITKLTIIF